LICKVDREEKNESDPSSISFVLLVMSMLTDYLF